MQDGFALESKLLAEEFRSLLLAIDPATWKDESEEAAHSRLQSLSARVQAALSTELPAENPRLDRIRQRLHDVAGLTEHAPSIGLSTTALRHEWQAFRGRAYPTYEALVASLRFEDIHVPSLRPTNYYRNVFHVMSGLVAFVCIQHLVSPVGLIWIAVSFASWAWSMEAFRRVHPSLNRRLMAVFGPMAHAHEYYRVNSATWYATALVLLAVFGTQLSASLSVIVLALGDPSAALIGRRFGRIKIFAGRSLEGSLAFVAAAGLGAFGFLQAYYPAMGLRASLALALSGAVAGSLAELYSRWLDDNFTIPVAVGIAVSLTAMVVT
jgi:dolichol kinase